MDTDIGFYLTSNDYIEEDDIRFKKNLGFSNYIAVSNLHSLHVLSYLLEFDRPQELFFFDINKRQILHLQYVVDLIKNASSRIDFLKRFFCLSSTRDSQELSMCIDFAGRKASKLCTPSDHLKNSNIVVESEIWDLFDFDSHTFNEKYGVSAIKTSKGLKVPLRTIGDVSFYYSTIFSCAKKDYETHAFPLGWGWGFLRDDESFQLLSQYLHSVPIHYQVAGIDECFNNVIGKCRYSTIHFWTSNIFSPYFLNKFSSLTEFLKTLYKISSQYEPHFPEIELNHLFDYRDKGIQIKNPRKWKIFNRFSNHTFSFSEVSSLLKGKTLEIVNQPQWVKKDGGISKLHSAKYMLYNDFDLDLSYDTYFFHILVGHGESFEDMSNRVELVLSHGKRVLVLEHNPLSPDFRSLQLDFNLESFLKRKIINKSFVNLSYIRGQKSKNRNVLIHLEGSLNK